MAGTVLHVLLRCKDHIDKSFNEVVGDSKILLYKTFSSNEEVEDFKRFLKMVILEWDCGKEIYEKLNWSEDEFRKLKEIKMKRGNLFPL